MKKIMLLLFATVIATTACNSSDGFTKNQNDVKYKVIVANPEGRAVQLGDILTFTSELKINDSLMPSDPRPISLPVMPAERKGDLYDAFLTMREGETTQFAFEPKTYLGDELPPILKEEDVIYLTVSLQSVQSREEFEAAYMAQMNQLKAEEIKVIEKYMADNNLKGEQTENGVFYIVEKAGTGEQVRAGQTVTVHYTGTLLDGTKFDSSLDRGQPLVFQVGVGQVIAGWDEGLQQMKVGEKCKLLIPSVLAYGERDMGTIPSNSILIFDVEVLKAE